MTQEKECERGKLVPKNRRYTEKHEWVLVEGDIATVGITDHAQYKLGEVGDLVYLDLPSVGITLSQKEAFGTIESVKASVELCSPLSGAVIEVNDGLPNDLEIINKKPYGEGWMIKIAISDKSESELEKLMDAAAYNEYIAED